MIQNWSSVKMILFKSISFCSFSLNMLPDPWFARHVLKHEAEVFFQLTFILPLSMVVKKTLYHNGIPGLAHDWSRSYLSNRQQLVFTSGSSLNLMSIKWGVPRHVYVLGPLLFLLYINDLNSLFNKVITTK